jgi:glutamate synthase domain-containing protein 2
MRAGLITFFLVLIAALGAITAQWPPAGFAFLLVAPLAMLGVRHLPKGELSVRAIFVITASLAVTVIAGLSALWPPAAWAALVVAPVVGLGIVDMLQREQAIRRNFPVVGNLRYLAEGLRPGVQQYYIETNTDGRPFPREERSLIYQRAKGLRDTIPFGTERDVYAVGYEWINHSMVPKPPVHPAPRVSIGTGVCARPYSASLLNISAMSFGSLSANAVHALNRGAHDGGFAHNTGEGGVSPAHLQGGDLIWQVGTGYFGCRTEDGAFDPECFRDQAAHDAVRLIELKLSQGAKPGHGGILPAAKVTPEIAAIRGVKAGKSVISPPAHSAFTTPIGLLEFLDAMRHLSGGKPVGFKLCIGKRREFLAICKAMAETGLHPDFIAIDGGEGGTGAAPVEFSNTLGCPLTEGLVFAHNAIMGVGFRDRVKLIATGKIASGFGLVRLMSLGADVCYSARAMMMAVGCIQARQCNTNACPTGVATQDPSLTVGLAVEDKAPRVARFHAETVEAALDLVGAAGLASPLELRPWHVRRRTEANVVRHYGELYDFLEPGELLQPNPPSDYARAWNAAQAGSFDPLQP